MPAERAPGDGDAVLEQQHQLAVRRQELLGRIAGQLLRRRRRTGRRSGCRTRRRARRTAGAARASSGCTRTTSSRGAVVMRSRRRGECGTCGSSRSGTDGSGTPPDLPARGRAGGWEAERRGPRGTGGPVSGTVSDRGRCWCAAGRPSGDRRDRATGCARCSRSPVPRHGSSFWPRGGAGWLAGTDVPAWSSPGAPRHSGGLPASEPGLDAGAQDLSRDYRAPDPITVKPDRFGRHMRRRAGHRSRPRRRERRRTVVRTPLRCRRHVDLLRTCSALCPTR